METNVTLEKLKEFIDALEKREVHYLVIAGFGLDGKRGKITRKKSEAQEEAIYSMISKNNQIAVN